MKSELYHPFPRLVENLPEDRKLEIERNKKGTTNSYWVKKAMIPIAIDKSLGEGLLISKRPTIVPIRA